MGRKKRQESKLATSRTKQKKRAQELKVLGSRLLELSEGELRSLGIPDTLVQAVLDAQGISDHEGRRRQLQYIGKLMRETDSEPVRRCFEHKDMRRQGTVRDFKTVEHWRNALIDGDYGTLDVILDRLPGADAEHIRDLAGQAAREKENDSPPHASRALFRYLRDLLEKGQE